MLSIAAYKPTCHDGDSQQVSHAVNVLHKPELFSQNTEKDANNIYIAHPAQLLHSWQGGNTVTLSFFDTAQHNNKTDASRSSMLWTTFYIQVHSSNV